MFRSPLPAGLGVALLAFPLVPAQAQWSVHDGVRQYAEDYVRDLVPLQDGDRLEVSAASVDTRLPLTECLGKLTADIRGAGDIRRNTHVYLQCHEQPGWELFVPVRVRILKPVVIAADPIARNTLLQAQHLTLDYQDEVLLRGDVFSNPGELIGTRNKRDLRPGQPIRSNQLCVVCKGDKVTILAQSGGLMIKTEGLAQEDGSFNDSVRIRNINSGREITARVTASGQVQVRL
ncbi:flagellar basal body P-ring formation chaperone FlgA [Zobellella iuensis]|uniref:Flagella basal body P-ring formation protein FlgA n=1 Tax=Zobellella iuensis TaxID=2803811 RepID=A0ABS1QU86_9GAMM|nr:flagellar basal body P-ring formation chaperone FlgA [Zobellella iuensis]MBL1378424.1 flagellar basal body P-ring formation protein FlgA [Zobellella iuensis]